ncbi:SDR family oxidoreductase [Sphingorhabdus sp.]|jgi:NAD(P)-dependent dehydrogenase (short-subunit alcohol dehydrogenase family)|uniref:SDR family oxidoreductase n=1 Tax=Sphingorhabdus sp. TaxID=1902408 RepID=UPI0037CC2B84
MTAALIIGAGDATGGAIARAFAAEGYTACVNRRPRNADKLEALAASIRDSGHEAKAFPADARDEDAMITLVETVEREAGMIDVAVFNIGANVRFSVTDTSAQVYRKVWEMAAFAGFLMGREVAKRMVERQRGTIIFTGATASLRGGDSFSAFSGAKAALRMLAQSMARELGPQGIHVAHVVIDGGIDTEFVRGLRPDFEEAKAHDLVLSPDAIAAQYVMLHKQHRSAWTHELDLRPWGEKF